MKNMGKSMPPVEVRKMMYEKAVNRCVVAKGDTMKNMKLNRAAVGQVVTYCAIIAAQNLFDLDRDGVERWQAELIRRSEVYTLETNVYGTPKARENLRKRTAPKMKEDFRLIFSKDLLHLLAITNVGTNVCFNLVANAREHKVIAL